MASNIKLSPNKFSPILLLLLGAASFVIVVAGLQAASSLLNAFGNVANLWNNFLNRSQLSAQGMTYPQIQDTTDFRKHKSVARINKDTNLILLILIIRNPYHSWSKIYGDLIYHSLSQIQDRLFPLFTKLYACHQ